MTSLTGRTALITGVSGGIGSRVAGTFGREGARVVGTYRSRRDEAERAMSAVPGDRRVLLQAELDGADGARDLWRRARRAAPIDTLVVNAAVLAASPLETDESWTAAWEQSLSVNVLAACTLMQAAARDFVDEGYGCIIVVSSWAAEQGSRLPDLGAYAASKAAVRNFAQTLARAGARDGLRVYTIAPGVVDAGMGVVDRSEEEVRAVADGLTMGRHVDAQEIADLAAFLATDRCPSLTGATLDLNGASYIR